ncbi:TPA: TetR/AcrR family transcriptional regulator, partial [Candidatus Bathyarchaeota archaeon]|nr:TetR/AcrR family transcriptional regulator [Candidatus Bathyarchaeota archaeon]
MGYGGFSYSDLSKALGITKASIHHHFPSKEELGLAV